MLQNVLNKWRRLKLANELAELKADLEAAESHTGPYAKVSEFTTGVIVSVKKRRCDELQHQIDELNMRILTPLKIPRHE
jgi:hypothetical protein